MLKFTPSTKSIFVLATLLILSSCGNSKLRFKRVTSVKKQKIIAVDDDKHPTERNQTVTAEIEKSSSQTLESETSSEPIDEVTLEKSILHSDERKTKASFPAVVTDSVVVIEKVSNEATIAQKAENISTVAVWMNRGALIILLLSAVLALFALDFLPLLVGAIIGFIMGVTAIVLGFISKSKSHNTALGSRQSSKAIIFGFVVSLLLGLILLLVAEF